MNLRHLLLLGVVSLLIGFLAFRSSSVEDMGGLITGLISIAAILFAVLGAWMSILKPVSELDEADPDKRSNQTTLALQISPALKQATFALVAVILLRLSLPVGQGLGDTFLDLIRVKYSNWDFPGLLVPILQSVLGACVTFLYLFEIRILLITLLPILTIESIRRTADVHSEEKRDPASEYEETRH
jgi:hypothetical protein